MENRLKSGTYGDEITLRATFNMFNIEIVVISTLGEEKRVIITPKDSIPFHALVLGHFVEEHGCHYVVLEGDGHTSVENSYIADNNLTKCESNSDIGSDYTNVFDYTDVSDQEPDTYIKNQLTWLN